MTAAETIAEWAMSLRLDEVPEDARGAAKRHILDGLGCALGAARLKEVPFATAVATSFASPEEATVVGHGRRIPAPAAALANGALMHALDFDDTHTAALVHVTSAVLPAALAVAEERGVTGAELLTACIAGYEVVVRLGAAVVHGFHSRGFHATSVCGVFASALAASRQMGLGASQTVDALGVAGSAASGSLEFLNTGSSTKQLHPGLGGMNGVVAARLAAEGASGPASIFEGEHGLFRSFAGTEVDASVITADLGSRWETTEITIKPYPACQLFHTSLDALSSMREEIGDLEAIDSITFDIPDDSVPIICEPVAVKREPRTSYEGKFSLPFSAASLLIEGDLGVDAFDSDRLRAPATLAVARKIGYHTTHPSGAPADARGRVEVRLTDGRTIEGRAGKSKLTDEQVSAKFNSNCGEEFAGKDISEMVWSLDELEDVRSLLAATSPVAVAR
jgi:2-methylcitrate dehydratase PrpD